jgi:Mannosylglycerate hydrolase MGH1-like glycoside hydrolase domain
MTVTSTGPVFSVQDIPFSYAGSWFDISPVVAEKTYANDLHLVSHQSGLHAVLALVPVIDGDRVSTSVITTPSLLEWSHPHGHIQLAYESTDTIRLRGEGLGIAVIAADPTLTPFGGIYLYRDPVDGAHVFTSYGTGRRYRLTILAGDGAAVGTEALGTSERGVTMSSTGGPWEIAIEEYRSARPPYRTIASFNETVKAADEQIASFVDAVAGWRTHETPAAELAAYVIWSATVSPAGFVTRPAVLMSKHWMDKIWSWDHCFNALALAGGRPELAWDQFRIVFDHQDDSGGLPDSITHSEILYNFVKPPIHGWALRKLRQRLTHLDGDELTAIYKAVAAWTNFWLTARRVPGETLPHYQHGNDSGWDNATTFDPQRVIQSADLAAFLVLQARELASLADRLGLRRDAQAWTDCAQRLHDAILGNLWTGSRFVARGLNSDDSWASDSLLDLMPIVLGEDLPIAVRDILAQRIEAHLTEHGLATELPTSTRYEPDGYWRGPVWAPSTILIEDGLRRAGRIDLADVISARFRALCERSGFAENFDAQTGVGLRDRAYTWTASAYLILAAAYAQRTGSTPSDTVPAPRPALEAQTQS